MTWTLASIRENCLIDPITGCWIWQRARTKDGYAQVKVGGRLGKTIYVNRLVAAFDEPLPSGVEICHHCDNPPCVNPEHWYRGTRLTNAQDMVRRGRSAVGERHGSAKLTADCVLAIRADTRSNGEVAVQFGVDRSSVSLIKSGKRWRHI